MAEKKNFWTSLLEKILKIIVKNVFNIRKNTHIQHVVPHDEGWAVKGEGNDRVTALYDTQSDAIDRAKEIARNYRSGVVIHREDGRIRDRISYRD